MLVTNTKLDLYFVPLIFTHDTTLQFKMKLLANCMQFGMSAIFPLLGPTSTLETNPRLADKRSASKSWCLSANVRDIFFRLETTCTLFFKLLCFASKPH